MQADFFVQGQDWHIVKPVEITNISTAGAKVNVSATLTLRNDPKGENYQLRFIFKLVNQDGGWLIDDAFCNANSLTHSLKAEINTKVAGVGESCGGADNVKCASGLWCDRKPGTCSSADAPGTCVKLHTIVCDAIFIPVCGCDGKDYGNDCDRIGKTSIDYPGWCKHKEK